MLSNWADSVRTAYLQSCSTASNVYDAQDVSDTDRKIKLSQIKIKSTSEGRDIEKEDKSQRKKKNHCIILYALTSIFIRNQLVNISGNRQLFCLLKKHRGKN